MDKILVIAEKPSVGMTIAKALNVEGKHNGYIENDRYIISWCMGHLLELDPQPVKKEWDFKSLPIIPKTWDYTEKQSDAVKKQLHILIKLMKRKDVVSFVCATDAGREGELIFRILYNYANTKKPFERLWVSSLEEDSIREGFKNLKPSASYDNLYQSALARSRADWLVGINATRLYTIGYGRALGNNGGKQLFSVGRVQTTTLNMIVEKQKEIDNYKITKQWAVQKDFGDWKLESVKFKSEAEAMVCLDETKNKPVVIKGIEVSKKKNSAPKLYSLTTLQQDANKKFGLSAKKTLDIMQNLYEKKMISYPRTDANYLTSDMEKTFASIVKKLIDCLIPDCQFNGCKQVINDSKVTDHYAIIVTFNYVKNMEKYSFTDEERKILNLIETRMIASISPAYLYEEIKVFASCEGYEFTGTGRVEIETGWRNIERKLLKTKAFDFNRFPNDIAINNKYEALKTLLLNRDTKKPLPYTEETLLGAMDRAGTEDMPDDAERKGLGTSATRASIIEKLISVGYIERVQKNKSTYLIPTQKGLDMISYIDEKLKSPKLTAEWEWRLKDIEKGNDNEQSFCLDIEKNIKNLVEKETERLEEHGFDTSSNDEIIIGACPICKAPFIEKKLYGQCTNKNCAKMIFKENLALKGHIITSDEMKKLINMEWVDMVLEKKNDKSKTYKTKVKLKDYNDMSDVQKKSKYFCFDYDFPKRRN